MEFQNVDLGQVCVTLFFFRDFKKESKFNLNIFRTNLFQFKLLISILIAYANKYVT